MSVSLSLPSSKINKHILGEGLKKKKELALGVGRPATLAPHLLLPLRHPTWEWDVKGECDSRQL